MEAREQILVDILYGKGYCIIPVYQRNYDWKIDNCKLLFKDIMGLIDIDRKHFCGSIVSIAENDNRIIIDGQQRLTTISLLLIAIYRYLEHDNKMRAEIEEYYLINRLGKDGKLRLKISQNNGNDFNGLLGKEIDDIKKINTNITNNFLYFYDEIK
jgi:uncharacterized protein with ParB-like and HNH nuclease domain